MEASELESTVDGSKSNMDLDDVQPAKDRNRMKGSIRVIMAYFGEEPLDSVFIGSPFNFINTNYK